MLDTTNLSNFLKGITDAIRTKKGTMEPIEHKYIDVEIASIHSGEEIDNFKPYVESNAFGNGLFYSQSKINSDELEQLNLKKYILKDCNHMFYNCSELTTIPSLDTSKVTNMDSMFYNCSKLTTIPSLDASKVINMKSAFFYCSCLIHVDITENSVNVSFSMAQSSMLDDESINNILKALRDRSNTYTLTLTLHSDVKAKLTEDQESIAIAKNWIIK